MSDKGGNNISIDFTVLAIVLAAIAFHGEPDLVDALIHALMSCGG